MPHATHDQIDDVDDLILVERGHVGYGGQGAARNHFKRNTGQDECECTTNTTLSKLGLDNEDCKRQNSNEKVERVGVCDVVAGPPGTKCGDYELGPFDALVDSDFTKIG